MKLSSPDSAVLDDATRLGIPVIALEHARQRTSGGLGVLSDEGRNEGRIVALCAHRAGLTSVPESFLALAKLERVDVGGNAITTLPAALVELAALRQLYIYDSQLERLPPLPALEVLDANRARLVELPVLHHVRFVYVAENQLRRVPVTEGARYLNVSGNPLETFEVADASLCELRAEKCQLRELPPSIGELPLLRELSLRDNALSQLPPELGRLAHLEALDLRGNQLDELPAELLNLPRLRKLDLRWNPMRRGAAVVEGLEARGCAVYL
jgi:Leucine-rich repeat (LRR) protein